MIEDEEFRDLCQVLSSHVEFHSRQTVSRDVSTIYDKARGFLIRHLQSQCHRIHIALDGWTSPNVISFVGVTAQYLANDGNIISHVLDFVK